MKRLTALFLILTLCIGLLAGCDSKKDEIPTEDVELWVVTELTSPYRMNDQAERIIEQFEAMYPNVTVKLDILPTEDEEREAYLQKLRAQIMGGAGPDAYLVPTYNYVPESTNANANLKKVELLFQDVEMTMYNGLFYDISEYYDADETLKKETLNTSVMDGGVMDGARYVLPLRYDFNVYLVDRENFEALGGDISVFQQGANAVMDMALELEDGAMAYAALCGLEYYFGDYMDYASAEVLVTQEEAAEFLRDRQKAYGLAYDINLADYACSASAYIYWNSYFATVGFGMIGSSLSRLVAHLTTAKVIGEELEVYPVLACDGTLHATIDYYAAVGAGSDYPRLAYEFIKLFLGEEAQHETYLATPRYQRATDNVWYGFPVRTVGSVEPRFANFRYQISNASFDTRFGAAGLKKRWDRFESPHVTLTEEEIPAVTWEVDGVHFPIRGEEKISISTYSNQLIDDEWAPTDADIDALAGEFIKNLQYYLNEG